MDNEPPVPERCKFMEAKVKGLEHAVYGNGNAGIKESIIKLQQSIKLLLWLNGLVSSSIVAGVIITLIRKALL